MFRDLACNAAASIPVSRQISDNIAFFSPLEKERKFSSTRSFISAAALLVKVIAKMFWKVKRLFEPSKIVRYSLTRV